ncbi:MAG: DUF2085 domain-containing protein [Candidatus Korobacteraceae bacterium]|jgi:uncharacterized membrane protein
MASAGQIVRPPCPVCISVSRNWWALVPLALAFAALAAPYLLTHGSLIGLALQQGFALVCHQRPERSLWLFGGSVAVCSRCLGIYLGAAFGLIFRTTRIVALRLVIAAAALNLLDAATELAGLHGNWLGVRLGLGFALGTSAALLISSSTSLSGITLRERPCPRQSSPQLFH